MSPYTFNCSLSTYVCIGPLTAYGDMIELTPYADMSVPIASIRDAAAAVRGRRLSLGLSQSALATRARVSRQWISEFEAGKSTVELGLVLRLLDALDLRVSLDARDDEPTIARPHPLVSTVDLDSLLYNYRDT